MTRFPSLSHALQAGLAAAAIGGVAGLAIGAMGGVPIVALAAAPASFLATWLVWRLAFRGPDPRLRRTLFVGPACVALAMGLMWVMIGTYVSILDGDLRPIPAYLVFAVFGLIYTSPILLPLGILGAYLVRRLQASE